MKQIITILLYPFAILYDIGTRIRNHQYDIGQKRSFQFDTNVIAVGNLSVGGTGKTPVVEYILRLLKEKKVATLSRGYGRKTKGFRIASTEDSARTLGDEPFQFYKKFPDVTVTVGEDRALAIPQILYHKEDTEVIVLDDAYQHRSVIPDLNIMLTEYDKPFFKDLVLPAGRLRESRKNAERADAVIVTKCPDLLTADEKMKFTNAVGNYTRAGIPVFFSKVAYQAPKPVFEHTAADFSEVFIFTGIANHQPFVEYLRSTNSIIGERHFSDHHTYTAPDITSIVADYNKVKTDHSVLITTEKDMVRLLSDQFAKLLQEVRVLYIPIEVEFLEGGSEFDSLVHNSIKSKSILP